MTDVVDPTVNFPLPRTCPFAPPPEYRQFREAGHAARVRLPSGATAWVLARYDDVRAMLSDPRFSSDRSHPGFPLLLSGQRRFVTDSGSRRISPFSMLSMDEPEHGVLRRSVLGDFTMRAARALRPRVQQIVDGCLDAMLSGPRPADLVAALALPVPSLVVCEMLGVPYAEHEFFQSHAMALLRRTLSGEERARVIDEMKTYLGTLITDKLNRPGDDLIGRLIRKRREEGVDEASDEHEELVLLAFLMLIAGHGTTASMISVGVLGLLENPDALAVIRQDPGRTPDAVEELLRYFTVVETSMSRVATEDVDLAGVRIRAGEGVIGLAYAANRDPSAFPDPDRFDIDRSARHHLAFGYGPHQCIGHNLARMELQVVFDTLFRRVPGLAIAVPVDELPFKDDANIYGLYELPVTW